MSNLPRVVLLLESSRGSGRALLRGIANYAQYRGPWAFFWEPHGLDEVWPRLDELAPQGFILRDGENVDKVISLGIPTVVVGHQRQEVSGVVNLVTDSEAIGRMAAEHLLECGFENFAFCGIANIPWSDLRRESFQKHLMAVDRKAHFFYSNMLTNFRSMGRERSIMAAWLKKLPKPVGIMACNDDIAQKVIEACKAADINVPDEVGVIGADNDELVCELFGCPLSSVFINFETAGYEAARSLDKWMRYKRAPSSSRIVAHASHIVPRQSTNTLAVKDSHVVKALRFIREHARENFGVSDVSQAAGLSRRALEIRFRSILARSILQEIRRVRVSWIARMLVETNFSVSQIAETQGYESAQHIARYFRQEKGMSPMAFRKLFQKR